MFDNFPRRNAVAWTTLVTGYVQNSQPLPALKVFIEMLQTGAYPTNFTLRIVLNSCSSLQSIELRKQVLLGTTTLHNDMILSTLDINSHGFTFDFPKKSHTSGEVFLTYKSIIVDVRLPTHNPQQSSPRTKYTIELP